MFLWDSDWFYACYLLFPLIVKWIDVMHFIIHKQLVKRKVILEAVICLVRYFKCCHGTVTVAFISMYLLLNVEE